MFINVLYICILYVFSSRTFLSVQVKELVGEELFSRYDRLLLQRTLDCMADVVYCPRPNCSSAVVLEPGETWAFCAPCAFAFCTDCRKGYHGVERCAKGTTANSDPDSDPSAENAPLPKTLGKQQMNRRISRRIIGQAIACQGQLPFCCHVLWGLLVPPL